MRGSKAKKLRRAVYKAENFRERGEFVTASNPQTVIADALRRAYQLLKKGVKI